MKKLATTLLLLSFLGINSYALADDFSFNEEFAKINSLTEQKKYKQALKKAAKLKSQNLNNTEKAELKQFMEFLILKKSGDDALRKFLVSYDKYHEFYCYKPNVLIPTELMPMLYIRKNSVVPSMHLQFRTTHYSNKKIYPKQVILHSDGQNLKFTPASSSDEIIYESSGYRPPKRECIADVILKPDDIAKITEMLKGKDVSFRIESDNNYVEQIVFNSTKLFFDYAVITYSLFQAKVVKPGDTRA